MPRGLFTRTGAHGQLDAVHWTSKLYSSWSQRLNNINNINATWNWHLSELFLPRAMSCPCQQTKTHFRPFHYQICLEGLFQCGYFGTSNVLFLRLVLIFANHSRRSWVILVGDLLSEHLSTLSSTWQWTRTDLGRWHALRVWQTWRWSRSSSRTSSRLAVCQPGT